MKRMEYIRANEIMKREIKSVAMATLCCLMIFTSCAKTTRNVNNDEQVVSKELSTKDATGKDIPEWVKGSLGEGTLFEKVDIDGIGGADDEVYIITGRFDDYGSDYRNGLTVVYVHLGTGEVLAQAILCKGNYETRFANLIPGHEGNQIILEITDGNSTYLATNIFVIAVSVDEWQVGENDADVMRVPVISKLLDTMLYRTFDYIEQTIGQKLILRSPKMVSFADKDDISSWAIEALGILSNADLFRGTAEGMLDPKGVISIEQAIVLSYRGILLVQNRDIYR